jgi:hypothetical protein
MSKISNPTFGNPVSLDEEQPIAEIIASNDELFSKILDQLDAINSEIATINNTLKSLQ